MPYKHLTIYEREKISLMIAEGKTQSEIARVLCRSKSTVSREIKRNRSKTGYRALKAQRLANWRRQAAKQPYKMTDPQISRHVKRHLKQQWSPDTLRVTYPDDSSCWVSHQTMYTWIRQDKVAGGSWYRELRQNKRKRRKHYGGGTTRRGRIKNAKDTTERPEIVNERLRAGDWESDTIEGAKGTGYVATHVCRKTKYVVLAKLNTKGAAAFNRGTIYAFKRHGDLPCHTFTVDRGKEFAAHEQLEHKLGCQVYFAKAYQAWQRGLNENTNGLLRQYLPKGMDFRTISNKDLKYIERLLNTRPRKTLGYQTPSAVMRKLAGVALQI